MFKGVKIEFDNIGILIIKFIKSLIACGLVVASQNGELNVINLLIFSLAVVVMMIDIKISVEGDK